MPEVTTQPGPSEVDRIAAARAAIGRKAWPEAHALLLAADAAGGMSGTDLEALSLTSFFAGQPEVEDDALERAFKAHLDAGDELRAAYVAIGLARTAGRLGKLSIASGWIRRAERLLPEDGDTYAHGYLALARSEMAFGAGDIDAAVTLAELAIATGERTDDADLRAWGLANLGEIRIAGGETPMGMQLLEEASIAAVNGELNPFVSGVTACRMISACRDLSDYRRASEWIEATERYCKRESVAGFPGVCRVHRAEVAAIEGAWDRAESDLLQATTELEKYRATPPQADGWYAIGDIRRLRGDFEGAQAALREAHARGRDPHPALALIWLAEGKVKAALAAIDAAVDDQARNRLVRMRLLPARIEIQLAAGQVAAARTSLDELGAAVDGYPSPALDAGRLVAAGRVLLAEGDVDAAARELRAGIRRWQEVGAPYEVARARALHAMVLRLQGDADNAHLELGAALAELRRLGAKVDVDAVERQLAEASDRRNEPEQVRLAFMFTDIVDSTRHAEELGNAEWERRLRRHDDTLRRLIAESGGEVVNSTGDGFFAAFPVASKAIAGAIAIQRAMRDEAGPEGAAPAMRIRIGIHVAEANRRGRDYGGIGVHVAARVGALAGPAEILATEEALREAGATASDAPREVSVKGVSTPLQVVPVTWA